MQMQINDNIFEVVQSSSARNSIHQSDRPLINAGEASISSTLPSSTASNKVKRKRRRNRGLQDLGFLNPGPKNLVNVGNVASKRLKTRQISNQEKPSSSKPLYDQSGLRLLDQTDRCDCNLPKCSGCFFPCILCQSCKCGLECRNGRAYIYEYRLFGTDKEIV